MNINSKILSIPPYLSTSWKNIASMHVENHTSAHTLIVTLMNGARIEVPEIETSTIETVFDAHSRFIEQEDNASALTPSGHPNGQIVSFEIPLKGGLAEIEGMGLGALLEHNPGLANSPNLPGDILERITQLSQTMGIDDPHAVPKPEPHCNCLRCQIAKAMQAGVSQEAAAPVEIEEIVSDDELKFRAWDVVQKNEKLYQVTNSMDDDEHYNVFLGDPIGCTCGSLHCEHMKAVLNT